MWRKQIQRLAARRWITISYLHQNGGPSSSNWMSSDRRDTSLPFLANHADTTWACDFIQAHNILIRQAYASRFVRRGSRKVGQRLANAHEAASPDSSIRFEEDCHARHHVRHRYWRPPDATGVLTRSFLTQYPSQFTHAQAERIGSRSGSPSTDQTARASKRA